jgi:nicotinamidase/pyrazinamidase
MNEPQAYLDVDTQVDFMLPTGNLYVPGAEEIIPNLKRLMDYAREQGIPVLSSADAHAPDDPSFAEWPPHCVVGTPGQRRIPQTQWPNARIIPNRAGAFAPISIRAGTPAEAGQTIVEKQEYDVTTNENFQAILAALGARRFVVFGVATEYCVRGSVLGLRKLGKPVNVVVDAIRAITEEGGKKAVKEMVAAGARLVTTEEITMPARIPAS